MGGVARIAVGRSTELNIHSAATRRVVLRAMPGAPAVACADDARRVAIGRSTQLRSDAIGAEAGQDHRSAQGPEDQRWRRATAKG
eukprot:15327917-Alexandrium_andersonii.AAC.1